MINRRQFSGSLLGATALPVLGHARSASASKPMEQARIVVGYPPGGTSDALARRVADALRGGYAKTVVVDNRPGASGQIGVSTLKSSPADGSAMLVTPSSCLAVYPYTYPKLPYKIEDLAPVSLACIYSLGFAVGPAVPDSVRNLQDYIRWVRADQAPRGNFGSPGAGSIPHLTISLMGRMSDLDLRHIPYRGSAPGIVDLLGGQIAAMSAPVGEYLQHMKTGKLRVLGTSGPKRSPFTPEVPTFQEQGVDVAINEWYGFFLPAGASAEVRQRAVAHLTPALRSKEVAQGIALAGMEAQPSTPESLAALLKADAEQWRSIVTRLGFTADS